MYGTLALLTCLAASAPVGAAPAPADWKGEYLYALGLGRTAGGTGMVVEYRLSLGAGRCLFTAEGYQTDERIRCDIWLEGATLRVSFRNYEDGSLTDRRGNAVYEPGNALFELERRHGSLITHWMGYPLADDGRHPPGIYLRRLPD